MRKQMHFHIFVDELLQPLGRNGLFPPGTDRLIGIPLILPYLNATRAVEGCLPLAVKMNRGTLRLLFKSRVVSLGRCRTCIDGHI